MENEMKKGPKTFREIMLIFSNFFFYNNGKYFIRGIMHS